MSIYTCPTCGQKMERDLVLFMKHTDHHVIEEIKKMNPDWITDDGFCPKCTDYYKDAIMGKAVRLKQRGIANGAVNIGARERRKRLLIGLSALAGAVMVIANIRTGGLDKRYAASLPPLFYIISICLLQARRKLCVILAFKNMRNMDNGTEKVADAEEAVRLRRESKKIILMSFWVTVIATLICALGLVVSRRG